MSDRRSALIHEVANRRQTNITVVLENVHDSHNIGAVMRTCDAVGIPEIYVLNSNNPNGFRKFRLGKRTSAGSRKWIDVHVFQNTETCVDEIRSKYDLILGTHLGELSNDIYKTDLSQSIAIVFGNEAKGISDELLPHLDGNLFIPMMGMVKSLNISVACAIVLYEAYRQRQVKGLYDGQTENKEIIDRYMKRGYEQYLGGEAFFKEE